MEKGIYITEFVDIYGKLGMIAENKTEVALAIFQEINKDRRVSEMNSARTKSSNDPASPKQIDFLKKKGIEVKEGLFKSDASKMIDEIIKRVVRISSSPPWIAVIIIKIITM